MPIVTSPPHARWYNYAPSLLAGLLVIAVAFAQGGEIGIQVNHGVFKPQEHFAFFTTWSSISAALCSLWILIQPRASHWQLPVLGNLAVSAIVVGAVYWGLVQTPGYWPVSSEILLHGAVPIMTVLLFVCFSWQHRGETHLVLFPLSWIIMPLAYAIFVIIVALASGWYPYDFLDASKYGWPHTLGMMLGLLAGAAGVGYALCLPAGVRLRFRRAIARK